LRDSAKKIINQNGPLADTNDVNYIFLTYVTRYLPQGLVGLLIAVILAASMSSTASELNALASTTVIDIYKRSIRKDGDEPHYLKTSRRATLLWGIYAIGVAGLATRMGSLIEAVNVLGSLFYGTILGIFLTAFYINKVSGNAVFYAALAAEAVVIACYWLDAAAYLWFNVIGCVLVMVFAIVIERIRPPKKAHNKP
jgi:Na+/proline symporter